MPPTPKKKPAPKKAAPKKKVAPMGQYEVPLELSTPHMMGQKVKDAQWLMSGHNRFEGLATYRDGAIDGDYGTLSAQATYKTKYWLGYPEKAIDRSFGQQLYSYLIEKPVTKLPTEFASRRQTRLKAAEQSSGKKALDLAITQIGISESPSGSNRQKYGQWYPMNGVPWCAIFCSWCFAQIGYKTFRYSYVPAVHYDGIYVRNRLCVVRSPVPGDLVCYNFSGIRDAHIGFFERWISPGSTFSAVEGNTSGGNDANGGEVQRRTRYTSLVSAFVRASG